MNDFPFAIHKPFDENDVVERLVVRKDQLQDLDFAFDMDGVFPVAFDTLMNNLLAKDIVVKINGKKDEAFMKVVNTRWKSAVIECVQHNFKYGYGAFSTGGSGGDIVPYATPRSWYDVNIVFLRNFETRLELKLHPRPKITSDVQSYMSINGLIKSGFKRMLSQSEAKKKDPVAKRGKKKRRPKEEVDKDPSHGIPNVERNPLAGIPRGDDEDDEEEEESTLNYGGTYLFVWPGKTPDTTDGRHRSVVAGILPLYHQKLEFETHHMKGVSQKCHPPYVAEHLPDKDVPSELQKNLAEELNPGPDSILPQFQSARYGASMMRVNPYSGMGAYSSMFNWSNLNNEGKKEKDNEQQEEIQVLAKGAMRTTDKNPMTTEDNFFILPPGMKSAVPQPTLPDLDNVYFTHYMEMYRETVLATMQVPLGVVYSHKAGVGSINVDNQELIQFCLTLVKISKMVSELLLSMYDAIFQTSDGVEFIIEPTPRIPQSALYEMEAQRVITTEGRNSMIREMMGISDRFAFKGKPEISVPAPGKGVDTIPEMIEQKLALMKADRKALEARADKEEAIIDKMDAEIVKLKADAEKSSAEAVATEKYPKEAVSSAPPAPKKAKTS